MKEMNMELDIVISGLRVCFVRYFEFLPLVRNPF
jgi:hypothetical protein